MQPTRDRLTRFDPHKIELDKAIWGLRRSVYPIVLFSFFINLLQLKEAVGGLDDAAIAVVNSWLQPR